MIERDRTPHINAAHTHAHTQTHVYVTYIYIANNDALFKVYIVSNNQVVKW